MSYLSGTHTHKKRKLEGDEFGLQNENHFTSLPMVAATIQGQDIPVPTSELTFLNTFDRQSRYPIFVALYDQLPVGDIISLTRTCRQLSTLYQSLLPLQWDIDRRLRRYVKDPIRFRSMMARCNAVIFGGFATDFFERVVYRKAETELSIMIQEGEDAEIFDRYLAETEGFGTPLKDLEVGYPLSNEFDGH